MEMLLHRFNKQYESSSDISRYIADDIRQFVSQLDVIDGVVEQVELCLVEIVNNAYEHAYHYVDGCTIEISCLINSDGDLLVAVSDYGSSIAEDEFKQYINSEFIEPNPEDPSTWVTSGRGLIIVIELMDKLDFIKEGSKNTFVLHKKISSR
ncbi:ATP-binding protein [uncultured Photobacterium sp.]|uniref:ATP-binding protein n=1 Tax=uncultured Photobacterium sp. TaxID=173973 RepID=UPI00260AD697|nr:ATP-binding protein [uncultured Photobacterium sp.]